MIRVIIERKIKLGKEQEAWDLLHEFRSKAIQQRGYVSGETLRGYDDPLIWVVISTWLEAKDYQAWLNSPERRPLKNREKELIDTPVKTTVLKFFEKQWLDEEPVEQEELEVTEEAEQK